MKKVVSASILVLASFLFIHAQNATELTARRSEWGKSVFAVPGAPSVLANISSTSAGGPWSSPSTWVGGTVPGETDSVTIAGGATVTIDTDAKAASVTIGSGGPAARLTFDETAARTLTISSDLNIGASDAFSTGNGTVNTHVVSIAGHLINNGTLDLSTNNNLAGATIRFNGSAHAIFGGSGAVTDVFRIEQNKTDTGAVTELAVSNFTVQGSSTDNAGSGFLYLTSGIFKISGVFTGTFRTFSEAAYTVPANAGLWLNNANYTIAAQAASAQFFGFLRVSAGTYNIGTLNAHDFGLDSTRNFVIEGGNINVAGDFGVRSPANTISGGTITSCVASPAPNCLMEFKDPGTQGTTVMSGGDLVLQNAGTYKYDISIASAVPNLRGTRLHFGSALTTTAGTFNMIGQGPNVILDSTAVPVTVTANWQPVRINDLNIDANSTLQFKFLHMHGNNIVNNGVLARTCSPPFPDPICGLAILEFDDLTGTTDTTYSGTGIVNDWVGDIKIRARNMTFAPGQTLHAYNLSVTNARVVNSGRIKLGNHDTRQTTTTIFDGASLDAAPAFDLGTSFYQNVSYRGVTATGPEINASRTLGVMTFVGPGELTIAGGDLAVTNTLSIVNGVIKTGANTITTAGQINGMPIGYVDGNLRTILSPSPNQFSTLFKVGANGTYSPVTVTPISGASQSFITIRAVDETLPGLVPSISASRYWVITEEGNLVARLTFTPAASDINGDPANYKKYRSNGGPPVLVTETDIDQLTGNWGLGVADPGPVSISGAVTTSGGQPIRNATLRISGGNLPAPVDAITGSFGTYSFPGLQAGESYTISVSAKRYRFTPISQVVTPAGNIGNVNFAANPQE